MDRLIWFVEAFQGIFIAGGETLMDIAGGILPMVLVLLTVFNAVAAMIGESRMEKLSIFLSRYRILSYTLLPMISWFLLANPMVFTAGKFLPQRQRAGFIDSVATTNGPMLSLFPHVNPAEIFIWLGIAQGVGKLGLSIPALAVRFFIAGWVLAVIRAFVTEWLWVYLAKRDGVDVNRGPSEALASDV